MVVSYKNFNLRVYGAQLNNILLLTRHFSLSIPLENVRKPERFFDIFKGNRTGTLAYIGLQWFNGNNTISFFIKSFLNYISSIWFILLFPQNLGDLFSRREAWRKDLKPWRLPESCNVFQGVILLVMCLF